MTEPNQRVVFMSSTGESPPGQYHLSSGLTLFPISSACNVDPATGAVIGPFTNMFAVPLRFRNEALIAGLEASSDIQNRTPQGTTAERPKSPADGDRFFDLTLGAIIVFQAYGSVWIDERYQRWIQSGTTAQRPTITATNSYAKYGTKLQFFDTSINRLIQWDGTRWVDNTTRAAV